MVPDAASVKGSDNRAITGVFHYNVDRWHFRLMLDDKTPARQADRPEALTHNSSESPEYTTHDAISSSLETSEEAEAIWGHHASPYC